MDMPSGKFCGPRRARLSWNIYGPCSAGADVLEMQHAVTRIRVDDSLVSYALNVGAALLAAACLDGDARLPGLDDL